MSLSNTEKLIKDIRRNTRLKFSSEEKIRIVLDKIYGLEDSHLDENLRILQSSSLEREGW